MSIELISRFGLSPELHEETKTFSTKSDFEAAGAGGWGHNIFDKIKPGEEIDSSETGLVGLWHLNNDHIDYVTQPLPDNKAVETKTGGANMTGNVLLMHLDEASGTIQDTSGEGNHGTTYGSLTYGAGGVFGKALGFDGVDDYVHISSSAIIANSDAYTISGWFKTSSVGTNNYIYAETRTDSGTPLVVLGLRGGRAYFAARDDAGNIIELQPTDTYNDNYWHHIVAVRSGSNFSLYVDKVLKGTATQSIGITTINIVTIGARNDAGTWYYFDGTIDEIAIFNRALSAEEIRNHFLRARVLDSSPQENNGTIVGAKDTEGKLRNALLFDGVDDYVEIPKTASFAGKNAGSISLWYKPNANPTGGDAALFYESTGSSGYSRFAIFHGLNGDLKGFMRDTNTGASFSVTEINPFLAGNWYHIVLTFDSATDELILYRNGSPVDLDTAAKGSFTTETPADPIAIGAYKAGVSYYVNGIIDEVVIYDRALSADEIRALYETHFASLYRSPRLDLGLKTKIAATQVTKTTPSDTDLKVFVRSGNTTTVDKNEVRHTSQSDFEAGLVKTNINITADGELEASAGYAATSTYESSIIDLNSDYNGDLVVFYTDIPTGTSLSGQIRSGNAVTLTSGGISGVTGKYTNPEHPNGVSGTLLFTSADTTLQWRDDSQATPTYGVAVDVSAGGTFKIYDGSVTTNFIEVEVDATSLPATDTTATYTTSIWTSFTAPASLILGAYKANTFSIDQTTAIANRFWQYRINGTTDGSSTWVVKDVIFLPQPTGWGRLETEILNCDAERYWQFLLFGVGSEWSFDEIIFSYKHFAQDLKLPGFIYGNVFLKTVSVNVAETLYSLEFSQSETDYAGASFIPLQNVATVDLEAKTAEATDYFIARWLRYNTVAASPLTPVFSAHSKCELNVAEGQRYFRYLEDGTTELNKTGTGEETRYIDELPIQELRGDGKFTPEGSGILRWVGSPTKNLRDFKFRVTGPATPYLYFSQINDVATATGASLAPFSFGDIPAGSREPYFIWAKATGDAPLGTISFSYEDYFYLAI